MLSPEQKDLLGVQLSELPLMTLNYLGKTIKRIRTRYTQSLPPNAISVGLVLYALVGCVALVFSLWCIRGLHTCIQAITLKHGSLWTLFAEPGTHPF